jgi:hypothetical protein
MPNANQEYTARRFPSVDTCSRAGYSDGYECELPADARDELKSPRLERILERPSEPAVPGPSTRATPWYFLVFVALVVIGGVAGNLWRQWDSAERAKTNQAISAPLTPQKAPTPAPTPLPLPPGSASRWKNYLATQQQRAPRAALVTPAPRAQLARPPVPRAQLVHSQLPIIGWQYPVVMPYGLEVLATYRGQLASEDMLPTSGNQLGDTWVVAGTPWLWLVTPGTGAAQWVDP